jgi:hypothetical protein
VKEEKSRKQLIDFDFPSPVKWVERYGCACEIVGSMCLNYRIDGLPVKTKTSPDSREIILLVKS